MLGKTVRVTVDRPLGSYHPEHKDIYYSVNYGYIEGIIAPDGEEQDVYILGVSEPVKEFVGEVIAVVHRYDDVEEKWVVAPKNAIFTKEEIMRQIDFQEKYFKSEVRMILQSEVQTMNEQIKIYIEKYPQEIGDMFNFLRKLIFESVSADLEETMWAKLPSYYNGEKVVRLIPFKDHINVEAVAINEHKNELSDYKITPKGMLQIFLKQNVPSDVLLKVFSETLN